MIPEYETLIDLIGHVSKMEDLKNPDSKLKPCSRTHIDPLNIEISIGS